MTIRPPFFITSLFILLCFLNLKSSVNPNEMVRQGIELGIHEEYDQARALFSTLASSHPSDPAPRFFLATLWQSQMMDLETQTWSDSFLTEIDTTIVLCRAKLAELPDDIDAQFYFASALAYKSFQISRQGQYLKGLSLGLQAMEKLNKVVESDSTYFDAYLGIGSYLYWRSYLTRNFTWLPFFSDQREKGISLIQKSYQHGSISKWAALSNLAWIYIKEEQYREAIECATIGLRFFPNSRFFLWPLGDAQFLNDNFSEALSTYQVLLESVISETFNNRYNETVLHLKIANCFFKLGDFDQAKLHAEMVLKIEAHEEVKKRLKEKRNDAQNVLKLIEQQRTASVSANE